MLVRPDIAEAGPLLQQPTGSIPTVTSTPRGTYIVVNVLTAGDPQINVRAGPSRLSEQVGVLLVDQEANAIGRYGDWVKIEYPYGPDGTAWVYGNLVTLYGGDLPLVEPPATATPDVTRTVDPTLAAQFLTTPNATRLPTYTEPAPLEIPTYTLDVGNTAVRRRADGADYCRFRCAGAFPGGDCPNQWTVSGSTLPVLRNNWR